MGSLSWNNWVLWNSEYNWTDGAVRRFYIIIIRRYSALEVGTIIIKINCNITTGIGTIESSLVGHLGPFVSSKQFNLMGSTSIDHELWRIIWSDGRLLGALKFLGSVKSLVLGSMGHTDTIQTRMIGSCIGFTHPAAGKCNWGSTSTCNWIKSNGKFPIRVIFSIGQLVSVKSLP